MPRAASSLVWERASFMKYFCAWVRTCVALLVPTTDAIAFTSLCPYLRGAGESAPGNSHTSSQKNNGQRRGTDWISTTRRREQECGSHRVGEEAGEKGEERGGTQPPVRRGHETTRGCGHTGAAAEREEGDVSMATRKRWCSSSLQYRDVDCCSRTKRRRIASQNGRG